jgi:hypothetical protein
MRISSLGGPAAVLAAVLYLSACDLGGNPGGSAKAIPASLTCMSSTLARPAAAKSAAPRKMAADTGDYYLSYRITPSNMEGRLIQISLMVGVPGAGKGGSSLRLVGTEEGFREREVGKASALPLFNLADRLTVDGDFRCCWETYPRDEDAFSGWFEIMFAYVDATFPIAGGALAGNHTVRAVFADVADLGYRKGDLLYSADGVFKWVDSASGEPTATRPAHPLQLDWVRDFDGDGDNRGNPYIPTLFVAVQDSQKVHMPADTVIANSWEFIADFLLSDGLIFRRVDPAQMSTVSELLSAFDIRADRDNARAGSDGISVNFYAIRTPLERPRPDDFKDSLDGWIKPPPADSLSDEGPA